jgi:non-specific protein-tyrosine kinase
VDADLRRPGQHTLFGLSNERGFTDLFRDEAAFNRPPFQPVLGAASLQLLASGPLPPIPSQILLSKKMDSVLAHLAQLAEIVIFDAPPILAANDALLLASKVDAVLLVVRAGHARRDDVQAAKDRLQKVNARLIGAVLTNAPVSGAVQYA